MNEIDEGADLGVLCRLRLEPRQSLRKLQVRAVQHAVGFPDVADLLLAEAAALQPFGVDRMRDRRVAGHHHVGRHVAREDGAAADEGMRADLDELVHGGEPADDHPVADLDVTAEGSAVGEHGVIADLAVMRHVRVGHEEIVAADAGHPLVMGGAAIGSGELAEHVAVADLEPRRLAPVFLVLWRLPEGSELQDVIVGAERGGTVDHDVRPDDAARSDADPGTDDGEGTYADIARELRLGGDDRARIDHGAAPGASIMSACATSCPSTSATVEKRQMPFSERCSCEVRISWSPGETGLRKRALSMPTK